MKRLLRVFAIEFLALYIATHIASGMVFVNEFEGFAMAAAGLAVASLVVRPIINILLLPITLATLGLFRFMTHAITLYVVDIALNQFKVVGFHFPGLTSPYLDLPTVNFAGGVFAYLAFAAVLWFVTSVTHWLTK